MSKTKKPRIIAWDIECTDLRADWGVILCVGWKVVGEKKTHIIKIDDFPNFKKDVTDDSAVCEAAREVLTNADGWLTWYGRKFDEPYLNTRLLGHKMAPCPPMGAAHWDGWRVARFKMKLARNGLASIQNFLGLPDSKTPVNSRHWQRAKIGDPKALKYVYEHCRKDVLVLEQAYERLKPLDSSFNVSLPTGEINSCPKCGAKGTLQKRGFRYAHTTKAQRYQCTSCGGWSSGPAKRIKGVEAR